jgi:hypothetical protein
VGAAALVEGVVLGAFDALGATDGLWLVEDVPAEQAKSANVIRHASRTDSIFFIFMTIPFRCATRHKSGMKPQPLTQTTKIC